MSLTKCAKTFLILLSSFFLAHQISNCQINVIWEKIIFFDTLDLIAPYNTLTPLYTYINVDGSVLVAAETMSSINFKPDAFLLKFDNDGNLLWGKYISKDNPILTPYKVYERNSIYHFASIMPLHWYGDIRSLFSVYVAKFTVEGELIYDYHLNKNDSVVVYLPFFTLGSTTLEIDNNFSYLRIKYNNDYNPTSFSLIKLDSNANFLTISDIFSMQDTSTKIRINNVYSTKQEDEYIFLGVMNKKPSSNFGQICILKKNNLTKDSLFFLYPLLYNDFTEGIFKSFLGQNYLYVLTRPTITANDTLIQRNFIRKIDYNGNLIYSKNFGYEKFHYIRDIIEFGDNQIAIIGTTSSEGFGINEKPIITILDKNGNTIDHHLYSKNIRLSRIINNSPNEFIITGTSERKLYIAKISIQRTSVKCNSDNHIIDPIHSLRCYDKEILIDYISNDIFPVDISIYNILGKRIFNLTFNDISIGFNQLKFNLNNVFSNSVLLLQIKQNDKIYNKTFLINY